MNEKYFSSCIQRINNGDLTVLEELYSTYAGFIYKVAISTGLCNEDAEDMVNDFFVKLVRIAPQYQSGKCNPTSWIASIVRNMSRDLFRKRKREVLSDEYFDVEDSMNMTDKVHSDSIVDQVLGVLSEKAKVVVYLHGIEDLTFREIADICDEPMGTITWRYQTAIRKLKKSNVVSGVLNYDKACSM